MGYISKGKGAIGRHGFKSIIGVYNKGSSAIPPVSAVFRPTGMGVGKEDQLSAQYIVDGGGATTVFLAQNTGALHNTFSLGAQSLDPANPTVAIGGFGALRTANYPATVVDPLQVGVFELTTDEPSICTIDAVGPEAPEDTVAGVAVAANAGEIGHRLDPQNITLDTEAIGLGASPSLQIRYTGGSFATQVQRTFTITFVA